MRKLILILSIFFLLIFTTIIKNSTKEIEKKIYNTKENLRVLKNKYEMVLTDFSYLTTPEKLMEYQSRYFKNSHQKRVLFFSKNVGKVKTNFYYNPNTKLVST